MNCKTRISLLMKCNIGLLFLALASSSGIVLAVTNSPFPVVLRHTINEDSPQRSTVTNFSLHFGTGVHLTTSNFVIRNLSGGAPIAPTNLALTYSEDSAKATVTFPGLPTRSLADGNYVVALRSTDVTNATGLRLDGNDDRRSGDPYVFELFTYFGDWNGDRDIDFWDNYWFQQCWASRLEPATPTNAVLRAIFDFDGDAQITSNELAQFATHYFTILPPQSGAFADLVNDTGFSPWDYYTADPTIAGGVVQTGIIARFESRLDGGTFNLTSGDLRGGHFWFDTDRLAQINGAPLADGVHTLTCRTTTFDDRTSEFQLSFTLDTGSPDTFITSHPLHPTNETTAVFTFIGTDALSPADRLRFECRHAYTNQQSGMSNQPSFVTDWFPCQSPSTLSNLAEGWHTFEVRAVDCAGNIDFTPATYTWFVDLTPPDTFLVRRPPRITNSPLVPFEITNSEPGVLECRLNGGPWGSCDFSQPFPEGTNSLEIRAVDPAGNVGPAVHYEWVVDLTPPRVQAAAPDACPPSPSTATTEIFEFVGTDNFTAPNNLVFECRSMSPRTPPDATNWSRCTSPVTLTNLSDGTNMFEVRAIDEAGNTDPTPAKCTWFVAVAPETFITSGPPTNELTGTVRFEFYGTDNGTPSANLSFQCRLDGGAPFSCSSPQSFSNLTDGPHLFAVWAIDEAGNADPTPAVYSWNVNTSRIRSWPFANYDEQGTRLYPPARRNVADRSFHVLWQASGVAGSLTGDLDGDGLLEVVSTDGSTIRVYSATGILLNTLQNLGSLNILADVTGDGNPEILVSGATGSTVWIRAYSRDGTLVRTFSKNGSTDSGIIAWMGGDLNHDGTNEIVAQVHSGFSQSIRGLVVFNTATGAEIGFLHTGPFVRGPVSVADINGDGTREILHGSGGPANGKTGADGSSDSASYVWLLRANASTIWRRGPFNSGGFFDSSAMLADLDHDGAMDVIACPTSHGFGFWDGSVGRVLLLDRANGSTRAGYDRNFGRPVEVVAVGDLEAGASDEIVIRHKDGGAQKFYLRILRAAPGLPDVAVLDMGTQASSPTLNDLDGDGRVEMLVALANQFLVLNVSSNSLVQKWAWSCPDDANRPVGTPLISDLNGDGINEIIVGCGNSAATYGVYVLSIPSNRPPVFTSVPVTQTFATNAPEAMPIDLSNWSVVQFPTTDQSGLASWDLSASNTVARQSVNAEASALVSDFSITNATIQGTFRVDTSLDDDWIGFVFYYEDDRHFHLFDWSQGGQNNVPRMRVRAVHSSVPVGSSILNAPTDTPDITTLFENDIGWADGTDYGFILQQRQNTYSIIILQDTNVLFSLDRFGTNVSGRFGFYNYSQEQALYSGFTQINPPTFDYVYDAEAMDPDGDAVTYALIDGPPNMTIHPQTGVVHWSGTADQMGDHNVTIEASDGHGGAVRQTFTLRVLPAQMHSPLHAAR